MKAKISKIDIIRKAMADFPHANAQTLAKKTKIDVNYIYTIMYKIRKKTANEAKYDYIKATEEDFTKVSDSISSPPRDSGTEDNINHPSHYKVGGIETIDFIEAKQLNYHLGNVIKYITRAEHKGDRLENLKKAQWYLNREINNLSK